MARRYLVACGALEGEAVVGRDDEDLGEIARILVDVRSGRVAYAVVASGGVLGIGERHYAVPWQELRLDPERRCFVLDRELRSLAPAPWAEAL